VRSSGTYPGEMPELALLVPVYNLQTNLCRLSTSFRMRGLRLSADEISHGAPGLESGFFGASEIGSSK
jgi:hypothetical protein